MAIPTLKSGAPIQEINAALASLGDGSGMVLQEFTVAGAPDASLTPKALAYVSNGGGGNPILAFSDGTNWKRSDTGGTIAAS